MSEVRIPTPAEVKTQSAAEDAKEAALFRDKLLALVSQSHGHMFVYHVSDMPKRDGARQILLEELMQSHWHPEFHSDQRDGDFWNVFPAR